MFLVTAVYLEESRKNLRSGFRGTTGSSVQVAQTDIQGKQGVVPHQMLLPLMAQVKCLPLALGGPQRGALEFGKEAQAILADFLGFSLVI